MLQGQLSLAPTMFFLQLRMAINMLFRPPIQREFGRVYPDAYFLPESTYISDEGISLLQSQLWWSAHWGFSYWHVVVPIPLLGYKVSCVPFRDLTSTFFL
jgi:hypothetical protein